MFARALVVLLLMLNLGVAAWWLLRPAPAAVTEYRPQAGVARLQLLSEVPARARPAATPEAQAAPAQAAAVAQTEADAETEADTAVASAPATVESRCYSFGPFADAASQASARARLAALGAQRMIPREVVSGARGWRVFLPAQADRAAAEAVADRISAAGFDDYLIVPAGDEVNSIALGRYGSERSARQRETTLRAAGFEAVAQPIGDVVTQRWLDVAVGPDFDAAAARRASGAAQANPLECAAPAGSARPAR